MRRRIGYTAAVLLAAASAAASAQDGRRAQRSAEPGYWVGLSYGYLDGTTIGDGATHTVWEFGYTSQIRATLEKTIQRGVSVGASAGFATSPLTYLNSDLTSPCGGTACSARADITQWLGFLHVGGSGSGFHGGYTIEAGVTQFSHFRDRASGAALPPSSATSDFTFGFGGGLGYGFSQIADVYLAEQLDFVIHPQGDNPQSNAPRFTTFRVGFRMGF
jgi:hypothetical protein